MERLIGLAAGLLLAAACTNEAAPGKQIRIADLVGMDSQRAISLIDRLDLEIEVRETDAPPGAQPGTVLRTDPPADTRVEVGTTLTLFVAPERELATGERRFRLLTHCGLSFPLEYHDRFWLPVDPRLRRTHNPPQGFFSHGYYDRGTIRAVDKNTLIYTSSSGVEVEYEPSMTTRAGGCD